ncbi:hypothetical protein [Corynebacterium riegelii]|uniref:hypothetical protein n=1 Tax=Corynebacterium riegelii TaxID=156976 RepID=UPI0023F9AECB|nr:hypothetical protein [Corynebacterium riegelii]
MTIRKRSGSGTGPEEVAELIGETARRLMPTDGPALVSGTGLAVPGVSERYARYFEELHAQVQIEVAHASRSFALEVAELAEVSLADWIEHCLRSSTPG